MEQPACQPKAGAAGTSGANRAAPSRGRSAARSGGACSSLPRRSPALIHPRSAFWISEQGLSLNFDGWAVEYRVGLERERINVTDVVQTAEK